ncbi:Histidine acid phosphatase [Trichostrongylus colubriformis]|uniref:Histidine acid phosphatase n=1 Tax=Trichostrongylus colubriformis TaxID=6319 RepID=A0AAN8G943_TRICO
MNCVHLVVIGCLMVDAQAQGNLVAAVVLFRHGARAPHSEITEASLKDSFPNGLGELTSAGVEGNKRLGKYLEERYVSTKFLRVPLLPAEVYFRSKSNNRCLMTGSTVGSQMFSTGAKPGRSTIPQYSYEKGEDLLDHPRGCTYELGRLKRMCNREPDPNIKWPMFEGFVFECMGLTKNTTLFKDAKEFSKMEALYIQEKNGFLGPDWYEKNKKEAHDLYNKVFAYNVGAGDAKALQLKQGKLLNYILETFRAKKEEHEEKGKIEKRKLIVFSTQDWILQALLNGIGAVEAAIGEGIPNFNSLIMFEMRVENKAYFMQVFYKDGEADSEKDITAAVRGCTKTPCPYEEFLSCCNDYKIDDPNKVCMLP